MYEHSKERDMTIALLRNDMECLKTDNKNLRENDTARAKRMSHLNKELLRRADRITELENEAARLKQSSEQRYRVASDVTYEYGILAETSQKVIDRLNEKVGHLENIVSDQADRIRDAIQKDRVNRGLIWSLKREIYLLRKKAL